jgi:hypothetical protein
MNDICTKETLDEFEKITAEGKGIEFVIKLLNFIHATLDELRTLNNRLNLSNNEEESKILAKGMLGDLKIAKDSIDTLILFKIFTELRTCSGLMSTVVLLEDELSKLLKE